MQRVTLANIEAFRQVAERGSIAAAAEAMSFTASAISQRLAALERQLGVTLLERLGNRVELTDGGRRYLAALPAVFGALETAAASIASDRSQVAHRLRLGGFPSGVSLLVPGVIKALREAGHAVQLDVVALEDDRGLTDLRVGDLDVLLAQEYTVVPLVREPDLDYDLLLSEPLTAVVPEAMPAASLADFKGERWLISSQDTVCGFAVTELCRRAGFEPDVAAYVDEFPVLLDLAAAAAGIAIMPRSAFVATPSRGLAVIPVDGCVRNIYVVKRKTTVEQGAVALVLDALREEASRAVVP